MKTEKMYVIIGIIVGTIFALSLTLYFLGNAWWQISLAIIAGSTIGCMVTDISLFGRVIHTTYKDISAKIAKVRLNISIGLLLMVHFMIVIFDAWFIIIFLLSFIVPFSLVNLLSIWFPIIFIISTLIGTIVLSLLLENKEAKKKVWGEQGPPFIYHDESISFQEKVEKIKERNLSVPKYLIKLLQEKIYGIPDSIKSYFRNLGYAILLCTIGIIYVIGVPFIFFKNILHYNKFLLVFVGVSIGTLTGTLTESLFVGIVTSFIPLVIGEIMSRLFNNLQYQDLCLKKILSWYKNKIVSTI